MELILWLVLVQGIMGAFDLVYHHEMTEKLTWKPAAAGEMLLHGLRNGLYAVVFASLGFLHWHGALMWAFAGILLAEVTITLADFVIEDRTRRLPASERVTHTLLALNYGAVLGLMVPQLAAWGAEPTGFAPVYYGFLSWVMGVYSIGVLAWFFRDTLRAMRLRKMARHGDAAFIDASLAGKSVLVTGGTGFIGHALCRTLIASGARVTVLTRDIARAAEKIGGRVTFIDGLDRLDAQDAFDIVINLAGEPVAQRWTKKAKANIVDSRIDVTQTLVHFMSRMEKKPRVFISGSAIGVYGFDEGEPFTERSAPSSSNPHSAFARQCCSAWEDVAMEAQNFGIRTVLLRIGMVLERDGGPLSEMLLPFDFCIGGRIGSGRQWFSWIHRDDIIGLVLHAIRRPDVTGPLNATAPQAVTNGEFSKVLGRAMKRPSLLPLPAFVLRAIFGDMADGIMLNGQKVVPAKAGNTGYTFRYPDISSALGAIFST